MLGEKGDYKSALALAEEVDASDPGNIMAHNAIFWLHKVKGLRKSTQVRPILSSHGNAG
jgi:hypothetical protein